MEKKNKAKSPRGAKALPDTSAKKAETASTKRSARGGETAQMSEIDALRQENIKLKLELEAANARSKEILVVTADVTTRLDAVIAAIRTLVKNEPRP